VSTTRADVPRAGPWRVVRHFLPSWLGCGFLGLGGAILLAGALLALLLSRGRNAAGEPVPGVGAFLFSLLVVPVTALLIALAVVASQRMGARALTLLAVALVLGVGTVTCRAGMIDMDTAPTHALAWSLISYGSLAFITAAAGITALALAPSALRGELRRDRREFIGSRLAEKGVVVLDELGAALSLDTHALRDHLVELVADGELRLRVEHGAGRAYTATRISAQQARIALALQERGRTSIPELARELDEPRSVVTSWIGELLIAGRAVGTIDREREVFLWDPHGEGAILPREVTQRDCERCGGALRALGHGLFRCVYCESDFDARESAP